jgi:hypothetical protein
MLNVGFREMVGIGLGLANANRLLSISALERVGILLVRSRPHFGLFPYTAQTFFSSLLTNDY